MDEATKTPLERCYDRVNHLVAGLERDKAKIVIPTPSLAEILVKAGGAGPEWLSIIMGSRHIRVAPFDQRAAVEYAAMQQERLEAKGRNGTPREKAKFDDQIIAIARVEGASRIYAADETLCRRAAPGIEGIGLAVLPLPPEDPQLTLPLEPEPKGLAAESASDEIDAEPEMEPEKDADSPHLESATSAPDLLYPSGGGRLTSVAEFG